MSLGEGMKTAMVVTLAAVAVCGCGSKYDETATKKGPSAEPAGRAVSRARAVAIKSASVDELVGMYMDGLEEMADGFAKVKDEASARKHAPELRSASSRLQAIADKLESHQDKTIVGVAFAGKAQQFMAIQQRMAPELTRIGANPALARELGDAMKIPSIQKKR